MRVSRYLTSLFASSILLLASAHLSAATYYLTDTNGDLPNGGNYAEIMLESGMVGLADAILFSVTVNSSAFIPDSNFGMSDFYLNYNTDKDVDADDITITDPSSWGVNEDKNAGGGFGKLEFQLKGNGNSRTGSLSFWIDVSNSGAGIDDFVVANGEGTLFAAHIAGYDGPGSETSAQFAAVVPLPAAAWLFGSALLGLGFLHRKQA